MNKKLVGFVIILSFILVVIISPFVIKIGKVECSTQYGPCSEEIEKNVEGSIGKSIYSAKSDLKKNLKSNFEIERFGTQFNIPSTLKVYVVINKPSFALKNETSGQYDLVDLEGNVVAASSSSSLPTAITADNLPKPGEKANESDLIALKLTRGVYDMYQVTSGKIESDSLIVELPTGLRVIFPILSGTDSDLLLGSLRLIESKIESDSPAKFREVDMRYKNPVLR